MPPPDMRAQIRQVIAEQVEPLRTEEELESFLARQEEAARRRGYASALEVEPGMAAIRQVLSARGPEVVMRRQIEFSDRMRALPAAPAQAAP